MQECPWSLHRVKDLVLEQGARLQPRGTQGALGAASDAPLLWQVPIGFHPSSPQARTGNPIPAPAVAQPGLLSTRAACGKRKFHFKSQWMGDLVDDTKQTET